MLILYLTTRNLVNVGSVEDNRELQVIGTNMWSPDAGHLRDKTIIGCVALFQLLLVLLMPFLSEARIRPRQYQNREDKDFLAMQDVNTNFLYTLVCDNSVSINTRMARYQCLLNRITPIDRSAVLKCVERFDLRSNDEFINAFCRGRLGCRRFRYCIARERETLMGIIGTTIDPVPKPTENALITSEPMSTVIKTTVTPTKATIQTSSAASPATATTTEVTTSGTIIDMAIQDSNGATTEGGGEIGRGDDNPSPSPPTSQTLQPEHPVEPIDDEDDYFPCLCAKKAKYLKRSSKTSRQGRSFGNDKGVEQFTRQQRQLEPAKLTFPVGVVRVCENVWVSQTNLASNASSTLGITLSPTPPLTQLHRYEDTTRVFFVLFSLAVDTLLKTISWIHTGEVKQWK